VPLAAQIILRCGAAAFTWKTAYDEMWASVSPGMLLFEACTQRFMDDPALNFVDSCCYDDSGYMASGWPARRSVARLMLDARPGRSVRLALAADAERGWLAMRGHAKRLYRRLRAHGH
jgi:CelD/BcsL family acetyltransferase involved in cellulose biosynthesis